MWHKFTYRNQQTPDIVEKHLSLVVTGEDPINTAMAKTVGLPLGIAAKLLLSGQIKHTGLFIPTIPEIYNPVLGELEQLGIQFSSKEKII